MTEYQKQIFECLEDFCKENEIHYDVQDGEVIRYTAGVENVLKKVDIFAHARKDSYSVLTVCPINADPKDEKQMSELARFMTMVNYKLIAGNFEMDFEDGEIRFRIHVNCADHLPGKEVVKDSLVLPLVMFDHFGFGLLSIIFGGLDAKTALSVCEEKYERQIAEMLARKDD